MLPTHTLGRTDVAVTPLGMGTAPLASAFWGNTQERAIATVERAVAAGIGLIDTAPLYGLGESEQRVGAALRDVGAPGRVAIATKVGRTLTATADGRRDIAFDFSRGAVARQLESSLGRLGCDRVDIVHVHDPEDHLDEALRQCVPALCELRDAGVIGAVSVGTNVVSTAIRFATEADVDAVMVAGRLTLLDRSGEELLDVVATRGVAFIAAAPFNSGVLARPADGAWYDYASATAGVVERARRLDAVCREAGLSLRAAALRHPLRFPHVVAVVAGMASPEEVDEAVAAIAAPIDDDVWAAIDAVR